MPRSKEMQQFIDCFQRYCLREILGHDGDPAKCVTCHKPVGEFRDDLSRKEHGLSGMCQACQDAVFAPPEEE